MLDTAIALPDGRSLAYTDVGASDGPLVAYFHGAPTSRLDLVALDDHFRSAGIRVVSPDRPGYGGSTAQPGRALDDWPNDVAALADRLEAERLAVIGVSAGAPHALACAALLGQRVAGAGVVAGQTDMGWPEAWEGIEEGTATLMRLGDEEAALRWCGDRYGADGARFRDEDRQLPPPDVAFLQDHTMAAGLLAAFSEALRPGVGGYAQDTWVLGRPWPFEAAAITAPVRLLHGEQDAIVPIAHARHTADLIAGASLVTFPEHGHLSVMREVPRLAVELAALVS